jgi:hypothetical protein
MRILPQYQCIYIHIPKTAGNSVSYALDRLPGSTPQTVRIRNRKHIKARELRRYVRDDMWEACFKFAFVRNPWDLMVSSYHWWLRKAPRWPANDRAVAEIRGLGDFTGFMHSRYGKKMINQLEGCMFDWIADENDVLLLDYIARFETLQEDWREICLRIGAPHSPLPHLNQIERKSYRDYYTDETREFVAWRFRKTIDTFGYTY